MTEQQVTPPQEVAVAESGEPPKPSLEELQKQLSQIQETSTKMEDNWRRQEKVSSQKEREIQRLREQLLSNESQVNINKALIAIMSQQRGQSPDEVEAEVKQRQPDLLKQYEEVVKQTERQKQVVEVTSRIKGIQERAEGLLTPQDDEYEVIRAFAEAGKFDKAEARLNKIEQAKQPKPPVEKPTELEEDRIKRLADEKLKEELKKRGLLTQETGGPSASASSRAQKIAAYARGEITTEEYNKVR